MRTPELRNGNRRKRNAGRHSDRHRYVAIGCRTIAELSPAIPSPTIPRTNIGECAVIIISNCYRCKGDSSRHRDGHRSGAISISSRAIAYLAKAVISPTIGSVCRRYRTGISITGLYFLKGNSGRHSNGDRSEAISSRAVAYLALIVISPTICRTTCSQSTDVKILS